MNRDEIASAVRQSVTEIAPDADLESADPDAHLGDRFGIDSMDFLEIVTELEERTGVAIPEKDYDQVQSVAGLVRYVDDHQ